MNKYLHEVLGDDGTTRRRLIAVLQLMFSPADTTRRRLIAVLQMMFSPADTTRRPLQFQPVPHISVTPLYSQHFLILCDMYIHIYIYIYIFLSLIIVLPPAFWSSAPLSVIGWHRADPDDQVGFPCGCRLYKDLRIMSLITVATRGCHQICSTWQWQRMCPSNGAN